MIILSFLHVIIFFSEFALASLSTKKIYYQDNTCYKENIYNLSININDYLNLIVSNNSNNIINKSNIIEPCDMLSASSYLYLQTIYIIGYIIKIFFIIIINFIIILGAWIFAYIILLRKFKFIRDIIEGEHADDFKKAKEKKKQQLGYKA